MSRDFGQDRSLTAQLLDSDSQSKNSLVQDDQPDEVDELQFPRQPVEFSNLRNEIFANEEHNYLDYDDDREKTDPINLPYNSNSSDHECSGSQSDRYH
jgi:hypothetical protein